MSQEMPLNHFVAANGSTSKEQELWLQQLEGLYFSVQPALSWALVGTGFIGSIGNILTIIVFARIGWSNTFQVSCTALAVSDLCCLLSIAMAGITTMGVLGRNFNESTFYYISNIFGVAFSRTTALITAWISFERCLCVTFPTRVKLIVTRTVTKSVLLAIFTVNCLLIVSTIVSFRVRNSIDRQTNMTLMDEEQPKLNGFRQFIKLLVGVIFPAFCWISVTISTAFLIVKLKQYSTWRRLNAATSTIWTTQTRNVNASQIHSLPIKERRAMKMVAAVAGIFLICLTPTSVHLLVSFLVRDYFVDGSLSYLFKLDAMVCLLATQINSSINLVVFTILGHNFRSELFRLFSGGLSTRCYGCCSTR